jgi:hypothetical protein
LRPGAQGGDAAAGASEARLPVLGRRRAWAGAQPPPLASHGGGARPRCRRFASQAEGEGDRRPPTWGTRCDKEASAVAGEQRGRRMGAGVGARRVEEAAVAATAGARRREEEGDESAGR